MKPNHARSMISHAVAITALFFAASTHAQAGPSFNCNRATADDEIAICSNSQLSELDNLMASGFQFLKMRSGKKQANQIARPLLSLRQACGGDEDCIQKRQIDAVLTYQKLGAPIRLPDWASASEPSDDASDNSSDTSSDSSSDTSGNDMPQTVGDCTKSSIQAIGGRLEGDDTFESGTSVEFSNGGYQISYDKEQAIIRSKIGDIVRICLVSLPKDCPPGDDRGKIYDTTNLRTGKSWELPDSQHMCGGA
jgi:uncharacterized protein